MNKQLEGQQRYWDHSVQAFDSIYSHRKSGFQNWLDTKFRWDMYARFDYTMRHSEPINGRRFLDVGCGTGRYAFEFLNRGAGYVVGLDIANNMLDVCRQRANAEGMDTRCDFVCTDLLQFQPESSFDVSIGIGLFDYVPDALPVLAKMRSVTTDRVIVSLPRLWTWRAPVRKARLSLQGCDVYFYSESRIEKLMKEAGFARYSLEQVGQLYCVTAFVR